MSLEKDISSVPSQSDSYEFLFLCFALWQRFVYSSSREFPIFPAYNLTTFSFSLSLSLSKLVDHLFSFLFIFYFFLFFLHLVLSGTPDDSYLDGDKRRRTYELSFATSLLTVSLDVDEIVNGENVSLTWSAANEF